MEKMAPNNVVSGLATIFYLIFCMAYEREDIVLALKLKWRSFWLLIKKKVGLLIVCAGNSIY